MKIRAPNARERPGPVNPSKTRRPAWPLVVLLVLVAATLSGAATYRTVVEHMPKGFTAWALEIAEGYGFAGFSETERLRSNLLKVPQRMLGRAGTAPVLYFDIKFKHLRKLTGKRDQAMRDGTLIQGADDFVPAEIRLGERTVKVKLRLKGDMTDHLRGKKWSFRIHTKGGAQIFGLRRFSLQHPATRGYHLEALFFETLRVFGVMAPRYFFVDAIVNGDNIGIMAIEEHFSKELLERHERKNGVIIRYNESDYWDAAVGAGRDGQVQSVSYLNSRIDSFQSSKIAESEDLTKQNKTAVGLLRGFTRGALPASDVFDAEQMGRFLAVAEFWGARHAIAWRNIRFYFNPFTLRLEPIAYDASVNERELPGDAVIARHAIGLGLLADPKIRGVTERTYEALAAAVLSGDLIEHLRQVEREYLPVLRREFVLLSGFDFAELEERARHKPAFPSVQAGPPADPRPESYPRFVFANRIATAEGTYLELMNPLPHEVEVRSIHWVDKNGGALAFEAAASLRFPLRLPATPIGGSPEIRKIPYPPARGGGEYALVIESNIRGSQARKTTTAGVYHPPLDRGPLPESVPIADQLGSHPFLALAENGKTVAVKQGDWPVRGGIVIPRGYDLVIPAGTTLRFEENGSLIVFGTTRLQGTAEAPIVLRGAAGPGSPREGTWQGVVVYMAPGRSRWSHVKVRDTTGVAWSQWRLAGGVTFYRSDVDLSHCGFEGSKAEDALNIVHADFGIEQIVVRDALSDGLDADYTRGTIVGGLFQDIGKLGGGDGIDVSGSTVSVEGTEFLRIHDKAISVGERSTLTAKHVAIDQAGIGAASKDASSLDIEASSISRVRDAAFMAYVKKPEYGPARLVAKDIAISDTRTKARVQQGSTLVLNGETIAPEHIDVERLYETVMKPGPSQ